jgi:hypothetical protein
MENKFIKAMKANNNWLTISLFVIAITLLTISLFSGGMGVRGLPKVLYFIGLIIFFITLLNTWGNRNRKYYVILMGISILLFVLIFMFEPVDLVQVQSKYNLQGHWAEDMAWSIGGIFFAAFMAGLVGIFVCIARWR